jgi:hypothetical protein
MPPDHPGPDTPGIKQRQVSWPQTWRIIASRFPPINLYERVSADPRVWESLIELEQLTNPRLRDEAGQIQLVPPERRVAGPNASWVMAPFTHINVLGSRFSNGTYGIYYAAQHLITAIRETVHHFARFATDSNDPPRREDMRVLVGYVDRTFDDVGSLDDGVKSQILNKDSYAFSQLFGADRRTIDSEGLVYPSVRDDSGQCIAAFWPNVVGIPIQERHLKYEWDGTRVSRYFDFSDETWNAL